MDGGRRRHLRRRTESRVLWCRSLNFKFTLAFGNNRGTCFACLFICVKQVSALEVAGWYISFYLTFNKIFNVQQNIVANFLF